MNPQDLRWIVDPLSLRTVEAGALPILRPAERHRKASWTRVLDWYRAAPEAAGPPRTSRRRPGAGDWIVALGKEAGGVGELVAGRLGRSFSVLPRASAFGGWLKSKAPKSVVVVAVAPHFDFETVTRLQQDAIERGALFGILTGRDLAGLTFSAAKWLLADARFAGEDLGIDAIFERQYQPPREEPWSGEGLARLQSADHRSLTFLAHGEGSHLLLNEAVLCGLAGPVDRFRQRPFPGSCTAARCKRAQEMELGLLHVSALRAPLVSFLSCNSFSVAGQLYPSEVSLVLAAAESHPAFVITNPWSVPYDPGDVPLLLGLLRAGVSLGEIVSFLNQTKARRDQIDSYVLFGDPLLSLGAAASSLDRLPREAASPSAPGELLLAPPAGRRQAVLYRVGDRPARYVFLGRRRALVQAEEGATGAVSLSDRSPDVEAFAARLSALAPRLPVLQGYENALELDAGQSAEDPALSESLKTLHRLRIGLERLLAYGTRTLATVLSTRLWDPALERIDEQIRRVVGAWDVTFAALTESHLLAGGVVGDRIFETLHFGYGEGASHRRGTCERCGIRTVEIERVPFRPLPHRSIVDCPLCGPLSSWQAGGPSLRLGMPERLRRGRPTFLDATMRPADGVPLGETGYLVVEVRDKTKPKPFLRTSIEQKPVDGKIRIEFILPAGSGFDQHSMRAVWIGGLDIAFARRVFVLTPDPATT